MLSGTKRGLLRWWPFPSDFNQKSRAKRFWGLDSENVSLQLLFAFYFVNFFKENLVWAGKVR